MTVKAKFKVEVCDPFAPSYAPIEGSPDMFKAVPHGGHVFLRATHEDDNYTWTERIEQAVPNATLSISITNDELYKEFEVGQVYELTFNKA